MISVITGIDQIFNAQSSNRNLRTIDRKDAVCMCMILIKKMVLLRGVFGSADYMWAVGVNGQARARENDTGGSWAVF